MLPQFPSLEPKYIEETAVAGPGEHKRAFEVHEKRRMLHHILKCRGAVRLRDIVEVKLDDSCGHCRDSSTLKTSETASKVAASLLGKSHDHSIVEVQLSDVRKIRFEVSARVGFSWTDRLTFAWTGGSFRGGSRVVRPFARFGRLLEQARAARCEGSSGSRYACGLSR